MDVQNAEGIERTSEEAAADAIIPEELRPISVIVGLSDTGCGGEDENCTTIILNTRGVDGLTGNYRMVKVRLKPGQALIFFSDELHRGGRNFQQINRFTLFGMYGLNAGPRWSSQFPTIFPKLKPELKWLCDELKVTPFHPYTHTYDLQETRCGGE